jgi:signal transduction histidine kinase/HAMP domain-containing protein
VTFKDLRVGVQVFVWMGINLALMVVLGFLAWGQTHELWSHLETLHRHPLEVRGAVGRVETKVESMARHTRDLLLAAQDPTLTEESLKDLAADRTEAQEALHTLGVRYLGPPGDVEALRLELARLEVLRDEVIRMVREGRTQDAEAAIRRNGPQGRQADLVRERVRAISTFSRGKADQIYAASRQTREHLDLQLAGFLLLFVLLSGLSGWLLRRSVEGAVEQLTNATEQFRQGTYHVRSSVKTRNEFGALSNSFNAMADEIETRVRVSQQASDVAHVMMRHEDVKPFFGGLLETLLTHTGSQVGAVYVLDETRTTLELVTSVGLGAGGRANFSASSQEGEVGLAVATRKVQHIKDIPADTRFTFAASSGDFQPRAILTIPILDGEAVSAVISLASLRPYPEPVTRLVQDTWSIVTARVNGVLALRRLRDLSARLDEQNRELETQKSELEAQAQELGQQNAELEAQKRQLADANRLKSTFLSNMSHELRTPLNSVIALAGVLSRRVAKTLPEEERSYLEIIERNGKNLLGLINDILDLSRIEAGREDVRVGLVSLKDVVSEVVAMLGPQAEQKGVALRDEVAAGLPPLATDPDKVRHILQNLVANAVKFTDKGSVVVSADMVGGEARVAVTDTGIGIAPEHLGIIFDEFRQADSGAARRHGGTGLGLSIARKYARLLGGDVTVESTLGQGSTFTVRLVSLTDRPAERRPRPGTPRGLARTASPSPGHGRRILVVEDSEAAVIQVTDIFKSVGYVVDVARNGKEALESINRNLPDAVILDLMMPEVDGFQVLRQIRGTERTGSVRN